MILQILALITCANAIFTVNNCYDTDEDGNMVDKWGDGCPWYLLNDWACKLSEYTSKTFCSKELCCGCGGGKICYNTDNGRSDRLGSNCSYYAKNKWACADTDKNTYEFKSEERCCACGGGFEPVDCEIGAVASGRCQCGRPRVWQKTSELLCNAGDTCFKSTGLVLGTRYRCEQGAEVGEQVRITPPSKEYENLDLQKMEESSIGGVKVCEKKVVADLSKSEHKCFTPPNLSCECAKEFSAQEAHKFNCVAIVDDMMFNPYGIWKHCQIFAIENPEEEISVLSDCRCDSGLTWRNGECVQEASECKCTREFIDKCWSCRNDDDGKCLKDFDSTAESDVAKIVPGFGLMGKVDVAPAPETIVARLVPKAKIKTLVPKAKIKTLIPEADVGTVDNTETDVEKTIIPEVEVGTVKKVETDVAEIATAEVDVGTVEKKTETDVAKKVVPEVEVENIDKAETDITKTIVPEVEVGKIEKKSETDVTRKIVPVVEVGKIVKIETNVAETVPVEAEVGAVGTSNNKSDTKLKRSPIKFEIFALGFGCAFVWYLSNRKEKQLDGTHLTLLIEEEL